MEPEFDRLPLRRASRPPTQTIPTIGRIGWNFGQPQEVHVWTVKADWNPRPMRFLSEALPLAQVATA